MRSNTSAIISASAGASGEVFNITVQPARSAVAIFHEIIKSGPFQGIIAAAIPTAYQQSDIATCLRCMPLFERKGFSQVHVIIERLRGCRGNAKRKQANDPCLRHPGIHRSVGSLRCGRRDSAIA